MEKTYNAVSKERQMNRRLFPTFVRGGWGSFLYLCWMLSAPVNAKRLEEPEKIPTPPLAAPTTKKQTVRKKK